MNMNVKRLLLRVAMLAAMFLGIACLNQPARADGSGCFNGVGCITDTWSAGWCGGEFNCTCFGYDGSVSEDKIDCSLL
jgi:hypothetical protein